MSTRQRKYRAWDPEDQCFTYFTLADVDERGMIKTSFGWSFRLSSIDPELITEYTGLLDKNGREIWEGDVVKIKNWAPSRAKPTYSNMVVEWVTIGGSDDMGTDMAGFRDHSSDEVIGNVWENPELLP